MHHEDAAAPVRLEDSQVRTAAIQVTAMAVRSWARESQPRAQNLEQIFAAYKLKLIKPDRADVRPI